MASGARRDQKASRCPAAHRVGVPAEAQTSHAENAASRAPPGRRELRAPRGAPFPGPAQSCPAPQPRSPAVPQAAARPLHDPGTAHWNQAAAARGPSPGGEGRDSPSGTGPRLTMAEEPRARPQPGVTRRRQRPLSWWRQLGAPPRSQGGLGGGHWRLASTWRAGRCLLDPLHPDSEPCLRFWVGPLSLSHFASGPSLPRSPWHPSPDR